MDIPGPSLFYIFIAAGLGPILLMTLLAVATGHLRWLVGRSDNDALPPRLRRAMERLAMLHILLFPVAVAALGAFAWLSITAD